MARHFVPFMIQNEDVGMVPLLHFLLVWDALPTLLPLRTVRPSGLLKG